MKVYQAAKDLQVNNGATVYSDVILVETAPFEDFLSYQFNSFATVGGVLQTISTVAIEGRMTPDAAWVELASHSASSNVLAQTTEFLPYVRFKFVNSTGATRYVSAWVGR